ncbi:TPA: tyrosine-protein kinase [Streptococcus agalactiae]|nr:tyrosine-protein kinase [Streptococcus agalactiae]
MTRLEIVDSKLRQAKKTEEYFNAIRTNIQFSGKENKILAITSVREGEGKSTTSTSLALSLAQAGFKTLLIDADTRNSVISGTFKATGTIKGLTNYLSGNADLGDIICETNVPRLMVVPSGKVPPNPTALLQNAYFNKMIEAIKNIFDYIIIDTPPIGLVVDAAIISNACDGFILVIQAGRIKRNYVEKAKEQMEQSGSKFLGIILNKVSESVATYGDYGDYGNYGKRDRKRK